MDCFWTDTCITDGFDEDVSMTIELSLIFGGFAIGFAWGVLCATPVFREAFIEGLSLRIICGKNGKPCQPKQN